MNGYICYYKNKKIEVYANTSYAAQQEAAKKLGAKKAYRSALFLLNLTVTGPTTERSLNEPKFKVCHCNAP